MLCHTVDSGMSTGTRRGSGAHRRTSEPTDWRISCLTIRDLFSTASDIRSRLPLGAATKVTLTAQHRARRLAWCHCHRTWTIECHRVLLPDESRFCLRGKDGRRPGGPYEPTHFTERQTGLTPDIVL
ncbi:hypothetical protein TNCV_319771 [Trichonephila clavipes]|nr:hypothetical protein TNCV_319771 [Trichonephila clavipes]